MPLPCPKHDVLPLARRKVDCHANGDAVPEGCDVDEEIEAGSQVVEGLRKELSVHEEAISDVQGDGRQAEESLLTTWRWIQLRLQGR